MVAGSELTNEELYHRAIHGAEMAMELARTELSRSIGTYGMERPVEYPETAYELPCIYGWDGARVQVLEDIAPVLSRYSSRIKKGPTLDNAIMAGETTMMAAEVIEALKYVGSSRPYEGTNYCGFIPDKVLRELGIALVDETIPGAAVLIGRAKDPKALARIV